MNQKRPDSTEALPTQGARSGLRDLLSIWGPVALLTLAGFVVAWQFVEPAPPRHLVLATGSPDGAYHRFGLRYQDILKRHGIEVELRNTAGSVENLQFLRDKGSEVEAAFLQGGLGPPEAGSGLEGLASLFYEPLWIFQREASDATLTDFAGRRVAIGKPGSGTHAAVQRLIENNELPTTALERLELGGNAAADALLSEQADVACFVASIEAPYIRRLLL
ncbi:MAG: ABC transporter substrate-binding protein, partial [Gammaproteobacteria bacterium]|nr:ABC transporter substrate-binding protein [Gammaproteobacteria bacterium]